VNTASRPFPPPWRAEMVMMLRLSQGVLQSRNLLKTAVS
jgi:hypothetical protein